MVPSADNKILLVGHCGPDAYMLRSFARTAAPQADVQMVNDQQSLEQTMSSRSLLLVNRVLDGRFTTDSGLELIRTLAERDERPPMMLISNFEEAQKSAVEAGALPGFGKAQLHQRDLSQRIRAALPA